MSSINPEWSEKRKLEHCLRVVYLLGQNVKRVFDDLVLSGTGQQPGFDSQVQGSGQPQATSGYSESVLRPLHRNVQAVHRLMVELESATGYLKRDRRVEMPLGNFGLLGVDASRDVQALHQNAVKSYIGHKKSQDTAIHLNSHFQRKRRVQMSLDFDSCQAKRVKPAEVFTVSVRDVEVCCMTWKASSLSKLQLSCDKIGAAIRIKASVCGIFTAHILLEGGFMPGRVVVHSWEEFKNEEKTPEEEVWSSTRHSVFQELTTSATVTMLHLRSMAPMSNKDVLHRFLKWVDSFQSLYTAQCSVCHQQLTTGGPLGPLPPCWRDLSAMGNVYHQNCKV